MIGRLVQAWAVWRLRRWAAGQQRRYAARHRRQRRLYDAWLAARVLPGTPKTVIAPDALILAVSAIHEDVPAIEERAA